MNLHLAIRKSSVWIAVRLVTSLTVGAFLTTYVIRNLSVHEFGTYTVLFSLVGYIGVICAFGIPDVFGRYIPEAVQHQDHQLVKILVRRGLFLRLILSGITVGIILLLHDSVGRVLKIEGFLNYFAVFACGIIFFLEASLLSSALHALFLHKYSVIASIAYTFFRCGSIVFVLQMGFGVQGILWAEAMAWLLWTLIQLFFYWKHFATLHPNGSAEFSHRRYLKYGAFSSLNGLGSSLLGTSTDFFIISAALGPTAVAMYAFADRVNRLVLSCMPHVILADVIKPTFFTKYAESGETKHLSDMFNLLVKLGAFFLFPVAGCIFVLGGEMIALVFKADYLDAEPFLWMLIAFSAMNVFANPTGLVLQAVEKININFYSKVFAVINLAVSLSIVGRFGVFGVLINTCVCEFLKNVYCYWYAKKYGGLSLDIGALLKIVFNAAVMSCLLAVLARFVEDLLTLVMVTLMGVFCFLALSWVNKAFSESERAWINKVTPRRMFAF